jgi:hypothetical protein
LQGKKQTICHENKMTSFQELSGIWGVKREYWAIKNLLPLEKHPIQNLDREDTGNYRK